MGKLHKDSNKFLVSGVRNDFLNRRNVLIYYYLLFIIYIEYNYIYLVYTNCNKEALMAKKKDKSSEFLLLRKRSCYLAQLIIFVRWTIKVRQVNQADHRFDEIISQISSLIDNNDEFLISSLENKIRHILNKK